MKFAKLVFLIAGIYGLITLLPQYFLEGRIGQNSPPPITHPEFYYGFLGVTGDHGSVSPEATVWSEWFNGNEIKPD